MPIFQEKFTFSLIEGLREINVVVWNSNTVTYDDFIGIGKVQLQRVLSYGYDDNPWPLQTKTGRLMFLPYNSGITVVPIPNSPRVSCRTYHCDKCIVLGFDKSDSLSSLHLLPALMF
ncbi:hypothetical protein Gohar_000374 [Gossypium harknessii]|uniref:C2 domain-containing protein n=2 Tax=Gossypium TaxID=3633 RepID=A0A7J9ATB6_9ROSI|nr:hypothetical protein [Gossypium laxum]MBA0815614.1 hypothetical protein [Gossypium harknessii]